MVRGACPGPKWSKPSYPLRKRIETVPPAVPLFFVPAPGETHGPRARRMIVQPFNAQIRKHHRRYKLPRPHAPGGLRRSAAKYGFAEDHAQCTFPPVAGTPACQSTHHTTPMNSLSIPDVCTFPRNPSRAACHLHVSTPVCFGNRLVDAIAASLVQIHTFDRMEPS